jgi:hypothetical protein
VLQQDMSGTPMLHAGGTHTGRLPATHATLAALMQADAWARQQVAQRI